MNVITGKDSAVFDLPMFLVVVVIVSLIGLSVLFGSLWILDHSSSQQTIDYELNSIIETCEQMIELSSQGSLLTKEIEFPSSVSYVVFGGIPISAGCEEIVWDVNSSNAYGYVLDNGDVFISYATCSFCGNTFGDAAIFPQGKHTVYLESISVDGESYVKIYEEL